MTLREQIASDIADVFLNNEDFAETGYYKPECGDERTITAVVDEESETIVLGPDLDDKETLFVWCSRDATTGIDDPRLEDAFAREIDGTTDKKWYAYSGKTFDVTENDWTLLFVRDIPQVHGGIRRQ